MCKYKSVSFFFINEYYGLSRIRMRVLLLYTQQYDLNKTIDITFTRV